MRCHNDNIIPLRLLSKEEAWELFMNKVSIDVTPEITEIAKDVVDECAYLPLAIIAIGEVMTGNDDISEWRVTLKNLRESTYRIIDMEEKVLKCLIFSYEQLIDEKIKDCFLYCAMYPEDYMIETNELVDYWIVEGLIEENKRQDQLDQGQVILNKLKHRCLLESNDLTVRMHDLIREMALYITKERFIVRAGIKVKKIQSEEGWVEDLERASFMASEVTEFSVTPKWPKLSTLFLNQNRILRIPPDFFAHMKGLKVLNLEGNFELTILPNSVSDLVNLSGLYLSGCGHLKEIPSLAKLTLLRTLKLNESGIKELPLGMEKLVNLRCLCLGEIPLREALPIGLIAKLTRLEELYLSRGDSKLLYEAGGERRFVEELLTLEHLEILRVGFACWSHLISYVGSPKFRGLKMFILVVGNDQPCFSNDRREVISYSKKDDIPENELIVPRNTEKLTLRKLKNLVSLDHLSTRCPELRECLIEKCENLEYVSSSSQGEEDEVEHGGIVLPCLEKLVIVRCSKLKSLCKVIPTPGTLLYLKVLWIEGCNNMKNVFSSSRFLELFQHLEEIDVWACYEMEELIASEEEEKGIASIPTFSFPKLKKLTFLHLPELRSIWKGGMICNSLQRLDIRGCDELKKLPHFSAPSLQEFNGRSQVWWDSLEWDDDNASLRSHLQPLFQVDYFYQES